MSASPGTRPDERGVIDALEKVIDPELGRDLVSLGMIHDLRVDKGRVSFRLVLTTPACPLADQIQNAAEQAVRSVPGVKEVSVRRDANVASRPPPPQGDLLPSVRNVVAVGSGKGGVGKSTVAVNLAVSLAASGSRVALLDADVYGPNIPKMMGLDSSEFPPGETLEPLTSHGVGVMSIGFFVPEDAPVVWRGPLVAGTVKQLLGEVAWGERDYMIIDLPPGTGDAPLTVAQQVPLSGALLVSTPQDVALLDCRKALSMFQKMNVPVLGLIENMSYFVCPRCGERSEVFGHGGAREASEALGIPFLGEIPLAARIRELSDEGRPVVTEDGAAETELAEVFRDIAGAVAARISVLNTEERSR